MIDSKGFLKISYLKKRLALDLLNYKEGEFIKTITEYQEKFNASRGSLQGALKELQFDKAIILRSKGSLGSQITKINYDKLLEIIDVNTVIGTMPLPNSLRYEGLATGFVQSFQYANFRFAWSYVRGSFNRIKGVVSNLYDFAIVSKAAADFYINKYNIKAYKSLGALTFSSRHVLVVKKGVKEIKDGMKIGIDETSFDQVYLTKKVIKDLNVTYLDFKLPQVISKILDGSVDGVIWSSDSLDLLNNDKVDIIEIGEYSNLCTEAIIVINKDRGDIVKILDDYIEKDNIQYIQNQVIKGDIVPNY